MAQYRADSLDELRRYASLDGVRVSLAPGEYWLEGDGSNPIFLEFSGSNSTFDLSGARIKMDTRSLAGYGNQRVWPITVSGESNVLEGLDFSGHDVDLDTDPDASRDSRSGAAFLRVTGSDNHFQDTTLVIRGSSPYGYGDVFGKGSRLPQSGLPVEEGGFAYLAHDKASGFLVTNGATNTVVDNLNLTSFAYGHGFFVQNEATNTTIRNSTLTAELCQGNDAIAHPEYQEYAAGADGILGTPDDGGTRQGTSLSPDIQISCQEDGIRMYSNTTGLTVQNVVVTNFRSGVASSLGSGRITIDNVEAYGTEVGFGVGSNTTITNSKADIVNGPAVHVHYNNKRNSSIDIEIVGEQPVGNDWAVAYLNGRNFDVTIRSDLPAGFLPEDSVVRFGQTWFNNWRDPLKPTTPEEGDPGPFTNSTFTNLTNEYSVLGNLATGNTGFSQAGVVTNGKENHYDGVSVVLRDTRVVLTDTAGLGNNGNDDDGNFDADLFEANASVVFDGATLELQPGIRITNEKLTITGDGVDGRGALYSVGTVTTDTRFGSSNRGDRSEIFLDGDASIGVGQEGNRLVVGRLNGKGDFTKRGPGILNIGKSSSFDGDMIIAEGQAIVRPNVVRAHLVVARGTSIKAIGNLSFNTVGTARITGEVDLNSRTGADQLVQRFGRLTGTGSIVASNPHDDSQATLQIHGDGIRARFTGAISGKINVEKSGGGTQILQGIMSHTGTTSVEDGTLLINGVHTAAGEYVVDGGTLGGTGTIEGDVLVLAGGALSPGLTVGTLLASNATFAGSSAFRVDIEGDQAGREHDRLDVSKVLELGGQLELSLTQGIDFAPSVQIEIAEASRIEGRFDNVLPGARLATLDGAGSFMVNYGAGSNFDENMVVLSDFVSHQLDGDFNGDQQLDAVDIDLLSAAVGGSDLLFDVTRDGGVTVADRVFWVEEIKQSLMGDVDFNGKVEFDDFLALSAAFGTEAGWLGGDFDGSGDVAFPDFLVLSGNFGRSASAVIAVPEPTSLACIVLCFGVFLRSHVRKNELAGQR